MPGEWREWENSCQREQMPEVEKMGENGCIESRCLERMGEQLSKRADA